MAESPKVDALEDLLTRREDGRSDPDEQDALWKASEAAYHATRREARRLAWQKFHERMAAVHGGLAQEHQQRVEKLTRGEL